MKIWICDDTQACADELAEMLYCWSCARNEKISVSIFNSAEVLLSQPQLPDLVFLDVELPGISGVETARRLRERSQELEIVAFTSYREYVFSMVRCHVFDYLEKPFDQERVSKLMDDLIESRARRALPDMLLQVQGGERRINMSEIIYAERLMRKMHIYTTQGVFITKDSLDQLYNQMKEYGFAYAHRSCIVNLRRVQAIVDQKAVFEDGAECDIARSRIQELYSRWNDIMAADQPGLAHAGIRNGR